MRDDLRTIGWVGLIVAIMVVGLAIFFHLEPVMEKDFTPARKGLLQIADVMLKGGAGVLIGYFGSRRRGA